MMVPMTKGKLPSGIVAKRYPSPTDVADDEARSILTLSDSRSGGQKLLLGRNWMFFSVVRRLFPFERIPGEE
jgi:hypothetical protein